MEVLRGLLLVQCSKITHKKRITHDGGGGAYGMLCLNPDPISPAPNRHSSGQDGCVLGWGGGTAPSTGSFGIFLPSAPASQLGAVRSST